MGVGPDYVEARVDVGDGKIIEAGVGQGESREIVGVRDLASIVSLAQKTEWGRWLRGREQGQGQGQGRE